MLLALVLEESPQDLLRVETELRLRYQMTKRNRAYKLMILCHAANVQEYKTNCYVLFSNKLYSLQYSARGSKQKQTVWNISNWHVESRTRTTVT
jgi:hypothetical protein